MTVALEFGNNAFPEFAELADAEKVRLMSSPSAATANFQWELAQNFFYRFRMFEAMHRTIKIFGDDPTKFLLNLQQ